MQLTGPQARADGTESQLAELVDAAAESGLREVADLVSSFRGVLSCPLRIPPSRTAPQSWAKMPARSIDPDYVTRVARRPDSRAEAIGYSRFSDWKLNLTSAPPEPWIYIMPDRRSTP